MSTHSQPSAAYFFILAQMFVQLENDGKTSINEI